VSRCALLALFFIQLHFFLGLSAHAENRVALLIGNTNYAPAVGKLKNPTFDVDRVGNALAKIGFEVVKIKDADRVGILSEVENFARRIGQGGDNTVSFFYYSGHGVARPDDRVNYLLPVDITNMSDPKVWFRAVALDTITEMLTKYGPDAAHFVVFDACRNELHLATKSVDKGFSPINGPSGEFIAFSTSPNQTASDTGDGGGPYAIALASELLRPGQDHLSLFQNVREKVYLSTHNVQHPWDSNGLLARVYFAEQNGTTPPTEAPKGSVDVHRCADKIDTTVLSASDVIARARACLVN
jgi:uncharacterized caspase-like protein